MNLLTTDVIHHSLQTIKEWDMDNDSTIITTIEPFTLKVNYNKGQEAGVAEQIQLGLRAYIQELQKQVDEL